MDPIINLSNIIRNFPLGTDVVKVLKGIFLGHFSSVSIRNKKR